MEFNIPHVAEGMWKTSITVYNEDDFDQKITLYGWDDFGIGPATYIYNIRKKSHELIELGDFGIRKIIAQDNARIKVKLSYKFGETESLCEFFIPGDKFATRYMLPNPNYDHLKWFGFAIANFYDFDLQLALKAYKNGKLVKEVVQKIEPHKKMVNISSNIFNGLGYSDIDMVIIASNTLFSPPLSISGTNEQDRHLFFLGQECDENIDETNTIYLPHIAEENWDTTINVYNTSPKMKLLNLTTFNNKGEVLDLNKKIFIGAFQIKKLKAGIDFDFNCFAKLNIDKELKASVTYQMDNNPSICELFLKNDMGTKWLVTNCTEDWFNWFGIGLANFSEKKINIQFEGYKDNEIIATSSKSIEAGVKFVSLATGIFDGDFYDYSKLDYVVVNSDVEILAPLSITGNESQDRHVFFLGSNLEPFLGFYKVTVKFGEGVTGNPLPGVIKLKDGIAFNYDFSLIEGYENLNVELNGEQIPSKGSIVVDRNFTIEAKALNKRKYNVEVIANENGNIYPNGIVEIEKGSSKNFKIIADVGYHVKDVLIDGVSQGYKRLYKFKNINDNHKIEAFFEKNYPDYIINIPDYNFKSKLLNDFDKNYDGEISIAEAESVKSYVNTEFTGLIEDLTGIEFFTNLTELYCGHEQLSELDVSSNLKLEVLYCFENDLNELDVSNNKLLRILVCSDNNLNALDLSQNTQITELDFSHNIFKNITITHLKYLLELRCSGNKLKELDISNCTNLISLICDNNEIEKLEFNSTYLSDIFCEYNNLTDLSIENIDELRYMSCANNKLKTLKVKNNKNLYSFDCSQNNLLKLEMEGLYKLESLNCSNNQLEILDLRECYSLKSVTCNENLLNLILLEDCRVLESLFCSNNRLESIELENNLNLTYLNCSNNLIKKIAIPENSKINVLISNYNRLESLDVFFASNLESLECNYNNLSELDLSNNLKLISLRCQNNQILSLNLENNSKLNEINCLSNKLNNLTLPNDFNLNSILASNNKLRSIEIPSNSSLFSLELENNYLENIKFTQCENLAWFYVDHNELTSLDVTSFQKLELFNCSFNNITSLNISQNVNLVELNCAFNKLSELNTENNFKLQYFTCNNNKIEYLDLFNNFELKSIFVGKNLITELKIENKEDLISLSCEENYLVDVPDVTSCSKLTFFNCIYNYFDNDDCPIINTIKQMNLENYYYESQRNNIILDCD